MVKIVISKQQPLNQGLIRIFGDGDKKEMKKKIVDTIEMKEEITPLNILDCMVVADRLQET